MSEQDAQGMKLDQLERTALSIIMSELEGGKFNWSSFSWEERK